MSDTINPEDLTDHQRKVLALAREAGFLPLNSVNDARWTTPNAPRDFVDLYRLITAKPPVVGVPQPPSESNPHFDKWVASLPAKSWAHYDLSACRLGWEAALEGTPSPQICAYCGLASTANGIQGHSEMLEHIKVCEGHLLAAALRRITELEALLAPVGDGPSLAEVGVRPATPGEEILAFSDHQIELLIAKWFDGQSGKKFPERMRAILAEVAAWVDPVPMSDKFTWQAGDVTLDPVSMTPVVHHADDVADLGGGASISLEPVVDSGAGKKCENCYWHDERDSQNRIYCRNLGQSHTRGWYCADWEAMGPRRDGPVPKSEIEALRAELDDTRQEALRHAGQAAHWRQAAQDIEASKPDINTMVDRFLRWSLPAGFSPDCGITFDRRLPDARGYLGMWPVGTNLFSADQARAMFEYALSGEKA